MNAPDILKYGHLTLLRPLEGLSEAEWRAPQVCGVWSAADIVAHLASYEWVLVDILDAFPAVRRTPLLERFIADAARFNDDEVAARQGNAPAELMAEYQRACAQTAAFITRVSPEMARKDGTLPWYGAEYDLDDFLVYTYYGHKREHAAQIEAFRDQLARGLRTL